MQPNRLSKILAAAGVASRRAAEELIFAGKVKVNGQIVKTPQTVVDISKDKILVNDEPVKGVESKVYYILNKPTGYVCSTMATKNAKSVLDLFEEGRRLFTVGRLDKDTQGLIIVTNDGHFSNEVIHPSKDIQKEYLAKTDQEISHDHLMAISKGTRVEGVFVKPVRVAKVRKGTLKIVIAEGKKREIRVLLENVGLQVLELTRIRIGGLHLGKLPVGHYRPMTENDRELLFQRGETSDEE